MGDSHRNTSGDIIIKFLKISEEEKTKAAGGKKTHYAPGNR